MKRQRYRQTVQRWARALGLEVEEPHRVEVAGNYKEEEEEEEEVLLRSDALSLAEPGPSTQVDRRATNR